MPETTAVITHQTAQVIVENVAQAIRDTQAAFQLLVSAKQRLQATLGDHGGSYPTYYDTLWDHTLYDNLDSLRQQGEATPKTISTNAWRYVIKQTGIQQYMTAQRAKLLEEQLTSGDLPALTVENILGTLVSLSSQLQPLLEESVKEVFEWLRPPQAWGVGALKTNDKWKIGPKVVVGHAVDRGWSGHWFRINHSREQKFRTLGNVLSILDGHGVQQYPHDLVTRFKQAMEGLPRGETFEDQYVKCKCFKNHNMHITFKRLDLVDQINHIGGDGSVGQGE